MFASVFAILLAALPVLGQDIVYTPVHNATVIYGTWSSGSMGVVTGSVRQIRLVRMNGHAELFVGLCQPGRYDFQLRKHDWCFVFLVSGRSSSIPPITLPRCVEGPGQGEVSMLL